MILGEQCSKNVQWTEM